MVRFIPPLWQSDIQVAKVSETSATEALTISPNALMSLAAPASEIASVSITLTASATLASNGATGVVRLKARPPPELNVSVPVPSPLATIHARPSAP